jgi:hypothetical protein
MYDAEAGYSTMSVWIGDGWLFPSLEDSTADPILTGCRNPAYGRIHKRGNKF